MRMSQALQAVADRQKRQDAALRRNEAIKAAVDDMKDHTWIARKHGVSLNYVRRVTGDPVRRVFPRLRTNIPGFNEKQSKVISYLQHMQVSGGQVPPRKVIAAETGVNERTLDRVIWRLEQMGVVSIEKHRPGSLKLA